MMSAFGQEWFRPQNNWLSPLIAALPDPRKPFQSQSGTPQAPGGYIYLLNQTAVHLQVRIKDGLKVLGLLAIGSGQRQRRGFPKR